MELFGNIQFIQGLAMILLVALAAIITFTVVRFTRTAKANPAMADLLNLESFTEGFNFTAGVMAKYKMRVNRTASYYLLQGSYWTNWLEETFPQIKLLTQIGGEDRSTLIYSLVYEGVPIWISMGSSWLNQGDIENWREDDEPFGEVTFYYPTDETAALSELISLFEANRLKWKEVKHNKKEESFYYAIRKNRFGVGLTRVATTSLAKFGGVFMANLLNADLTFNGKLYKAGTYNMSNLFTKLIQTFGEWKPNGIFFGNPGTGKTGALNALCYFISKFNPKTITILVTADVLLDTDTIEAISVELAEMQEQHYRMHGFKPTVVFLIDEADSAVIGKVSEDGKIVKSRSNELLLSLMNGTKSEIINCHVFMTVNLERHQIHEAFLRDNRCHFALDFQSLDKESAVRLSGYVKDNLDKGFIFDEERFKEILASDKPITVASVFGCASPRGVNDILHNIVKALENTISGAPTKGDDDLLETLQTWSESLKEESEEDRLLDRIEEGDDLISTTEEIIQLNTGVEDMAQTFIPEGLITANPKKQQYYSKKKHKKNRR